VEVLHKIDGVAALFAAATVSEIFPRIDAEAVVAATDRAGSDKLTADGTKGMTAAHILARYGACAIDGILRDSG
jgi:hypothetical protein